MFRRALTAHLKNLVRHLGLTFLVILSLPSWGAPSASPPDKFVANLEPYSQTFTELTNFAKSKDTKAAAEATRKFALAHHAQWLELNEAMVQYMQKHRDHPEYFKSEYNLKVSDLQQAWTFVDEAVRNPKSCPRQLEASRRMSEPEEGQSRKVDDVYELAVKSLELLCGKPAAKAPALVPGR